MNLAKKRMDVAEYLEWGLGQERGRFELVDGQIVSMSAEVARHARAKLAAVIALRAAIARAGLNCEAFTDGMTVAIDKHNAREPDASVQCGPIDPDTMVLEKPIVVVEVLFPSTGRTDTGAKLADYFSVVSVRHYLIVDPIKRLIIHHARSGSGKINTRIVETGEITLAPPGLAVTVEEMLGELQR